MRLLNHFVVHFGAALSRLGLALAIAAGLHATPPVAAAERSGEDIDGLRPVLAEFCFDCHGVERQKASLNLEAISQSSVLENRKTWQKVLEMVSKREMPPENRPQPTLEEREQVVAFIERGMAELNCDGWVNPGRVTIRRLNRTEYNNTIRDLVGVDFRPAADFPPDDVGHGFDNIADALSIPPILLEKYLDAAEEIAERALVADYPPAPPVERIAGERLEPAPGSDSIRPAERGALGLFREGEAAKQWKVEEGGRFRVRLRAYGDQAGPEPPQLALRVDGKEISVFEVEAVQGKGEIYSAEVSLESGTHRLAVAYLNNYNVQDHPDPRMNGDRNLYVDEVELEGPTDRPPPPLPESHRQIMICQPAPGQESECAERIVRRLVNRAFRRPATDQEVERLMRFVDLAREEGGNFTEGIQLALQAILVSPQFLFRTELDPRTASDARSRELSDYELASRLSYFLWSSMPDEELFHLAEQGVLGRDQVLAAQVKRMLQDPKADALVTNFGGQWLQFRNLGQVSPDPELFPEFDDELRSAMQRESELFFAAIMREDRSVLEFIDSDFSFLNERLANHYGIVGIEGDEFQRVEWPKNSPRGGILTHASILTLTSNPTRTSPVNRGKWVLEQILGSPPPPPPPDAGELSEDPEVVEAASLRKRLEIHRAKPECAACHDKMDPIGFAFENFDAIGGWRDLDGRFPIDPSGTLPDGTAIDGPASLKSYLKSQETFVRTAIEKMLVYAVGRGLEYYDSCAVDRIYERLVQDNFKFSTLVTEIVKSAPFRMRVIEGDPT